MYTKNSPLTEDAKRFIEDNISEKPVRLAEQLNIPYHTVAWYHWYVRKNMSWDYNTCPITGFKN